MRKFRDFLLKKSKGYSWFVGMWFAIFILVLAWTTLQWYSVSENCDRVENIITDSALASLEYDTTDYALTKSKTLKEFRGMYDPNTNFWLLCKYIERNLRYKGNHTSPAYNGTERNYDGTFTVTGDYLDGEEGQCRILRAVFYNVSESGIEIHEYTASMFGFTLIKKSAPSITTPKGDEVVNTSVFVDFEFPVKFAGNIRMVRRQVYASITEQ